MSKKPFTPITDPEIWPILGDRPLIDPPRLRRTWSNSRLVIQEDGSTIPLLHILAEHKFGPWDASSQRPFWKDMDWTNECLDNVALTGVFGSRPQRPKNTSGFPSGSPEYYKWYRTQNKDKVRQWAKNSYSKRKENTQSLRDIRLELEATRAQLSALKASPSIQSVEATAADLQNDLDEIMRTALGEGSSLPQPSDEETT
jgi:hypothetical protein